MTLFKNTNLWVCFGVVSLFFVLFLHPIEDPDIWFHMTIGRAVMEQGAVPAQEFYIFTRLGQPSEFHEWGFGVIYHWVHTLFGNVGIIVFNALLGAFTVFLLFLTVRCRGISFAIALAAAAIAFWLLEFRFVQRPENFLYLAIAGTLLCLEKYRIDLNWRYLIPIPIMGFALSQAHPSVIMLGLVVGTYLTESVFRRGVKQFQAYHLSLVIVSTLLVSLINPYGLEQLILPIKFSMQNDFLQEFTEFLPALSTAYAYRFVIGLLIAVFALILTLPRGRKSLGLAEWLMLIAFSYLAYNHVRDIALLGIALVLPLAVAFSVTVVSDKYRNIIAACLLLVFAVDTMRSHEPDISASPLLAPVLGAEVIARYSQGGNILNFYHLGNYLAWRLGSTHNVIIDGRNFKDNPSLTLHDALLTAKYGWQNSLQRYGIEAVVTPATLPYSGNFIPLAFELIRNPRWVMLSREQSGVVFMRRDKIPDDVAVLSERELWLQAKSELTINLIYYPDSESSQKSMLLVERKLGSL